MNTLRKVQLQGHIPVNCYFIEKDGACYIVDPGYQKERIVDYLEWNGLTAVGILLTHAHIDHIGALDCCDVPVFVHESDYDVLIDDASNGFEFYGKKKAYRPDDLEIIKIVDGETLPSGDGFISVIHTPGHTVGGVCYRIDDDLYTGDTLFAGGVGRWDRPTADFEQLKSSLLGIMDSQADHVRIHPGHGESSTIGREKAFNPFYHAWKAQG